MTKCPLCLDGIIEYRHNKLDDTTQDTHVYVCDSCPFIGFEYYTDVNLSELKKLIK